MPRRPSGSDAHVNRRRSSIANPSGQSQPATPPRPAAAGPGQARNPKMAVLAAANRLRDTTGTPGRSVSGTLGAAPLVVESQRYEEWMKIATDNKITSTNTWNLALIDYFHDMSLLRNGDDNSINFQKASCTLDGCVKIWTSRVDSVATETGKLLSGLGDDAQPMDDDEDMDGEGEDGQGRPEKRARKRTARQAATLADDFAKLRVKQFDLEFTVDPLFKKTSADFDEGGAGGILMNHLGCDGSMKVVFDAGDAKLDCDEEDEEEGEDPVRAQQAQDETLQVDLSRLRDRCLPDGLDPLAAMSLCPSLSFFRFSDAHLDLGLLNLGGDEDDDDEMPLNAARKPAAAQRDLPEGGDDDNAVDFNDAYMNQDFGGGGGYDFGGDPDGGVDFFADQFSGEAAAYGLAGAGPVASGSGLGNSTGGGGGTGFGAVEPFDPRRMADERDLVMSMEGDGDGMFEYFDAKLGKNWAGPEHWKMRRGAAVKKDEGAPVAKKERKEKVAFSIDFSNPPPLSAKELFASANPKSSITTATRKTARKATAVNGEDDFTLPDDYHFNSQNLLRLFLKPKMTLRMRRRNVQMGEPTGGEEDVRFWAQAGAAGAALGEEGYGGGMDPMDHDFNQDFGGGGDGDDDDPPPFDTQWLAGGEDDFSPDLEDEEGEGKELDDLAAATQGQLRRVRPEMVSYAKRAKRVDIKKLKDSVWRELEEVVLPVKHYPESPSYDPKEPGPEVVEAAPKAKDVKPRKKAEALVPVVSGLRKLYPKDKMEEISTSFMFICLLHLANEKGLRLQTPRFEHDDENAAHEADMQKIVGGLESLRVLKEVA